jgi:hypothetical protein
MKKKVNKLTIHRETLRYLDRLQGVNGGSGPGPTHALGCTPTRVGTQCVTDTGSDSVCQISYICSSGCGTGGACTVTCANC